MENNELRAKLGKKLAEISKLIGKMAQDGKNTHSGYKFISYEAVAGELRSAMASVGISIIPSIVEYKEQEIKNNKGTQFVKTIVKMVFCIIDNETGYSETATWFGSDQDSGGKSFAQAITEGQKRFQMKLFNISSKGDIDPDSKTTEVNLDPVPKRTPQKNEPVRRTVVAPAPKAQVEKKQVSYADDPFGDAL